MIRFEPLLIRQNRVFADRHQDELPDGFFAGKTGGGSRVIRRNDIPVGLVDFYPEGDEVILNVYFVSGTDDRRRLLAVVTENLVRRYHPEKIVIKDSFSELSGVYESNSYRMENGKWTKRIEPWRKILNDAVFDDEGFIINQGRMKEIPFGWFDTRAKGCGWIAAYNLLKMNGMETTMEECAHELEKHSLLGKMLGQNLFPLYAWLKKKGLNVKMSLPANSSALKLISESGSGIILYNHSRGAHYVTYRRLNRSEIQVFNAVYGKRMHVSGAKEFMKKYSLFPTSVVIGVK